MANPKHGKDIIWIILAWLIALSIVFITISKLSYFTHKN